jgi:alpha-glucuronidase
VNPKTPRRLAPWLAAVLAVLAPAARAEDGYRLWLRYDALPEAVAAPARSALARIVLAVPGGAESPAIGASRDELAAGLGGLLGAEVPVATVSLPLRIVALGDEGYSLSSAVSDGAATVTISANTGAGILHGAFALLRRVQTGAPLRGLEETSAPRVARRILDHWDNLNRSIERGYAGSSLWNWFTLPEVLDPRYRDYARACASIGINGTVLTNVNANALVLTPYYLERVAALASVFRPYGIRVYLSARFTAPMELGGLKTADPLDPAVAGWWRAKVDEIYRYVPDFGGFLVKANSEGQPGPQDYGRSHADGANMLADALAPYGGIVMWRAFVYRAEDREDRVKQAYREFLPLDGRFRDNVVVQIKNGPLDFMPREPFHPLFGAMPRTNLALEVQITQEYLGSSVQLAYLGTLWKEVLDADTFRSGPGTTVARIVDGSVGGLKLTVMAGVANTGTDRDWTGHPLAQANWYAFGRLAWDPGLGADSIADEWVRMTYGTDPGVDRTISGMLLGSREAVVDYSMPLGLHHIMAEGHHYGPGPWATSTRPDWNSSYYHQADAVGLGASRSADGSNAVGTYAPELAKAWGSLDTCPENLLLWFHHVPWDHRMKSGRVLWDELCLRYQRGVDEARGLRTSWASLEGKVDAERFAHVASLLARQESDARDWRDACLLYFQKFSKRPLPPGVEAPAHDLAFYEAVKLRYFPGHPGDP